MADVKAMCSSSMLFRTTMNVMDLISLSAKLLWLFYLAANNCTKHGPQMHFKGGKTIRDLLVTPKNEIYRYKYGRLECEEEYITESGKYLEKGLKNI